MNKNAVPVVKNMDLKTADRLVELRKTHGLSQEALAEKLGISRQSISKWERGESSPDTDNLIALAKIYGITLDDVLNHEKDVEAPKEPEQSNAKGEKEIKNKKPSLYGKLGKRLFKFPFWVLVIGGYVAYNLAFNNWHPTWLVFLLLPIYYHFAGVCYVKSKKAFLLSLPIPEIVLLVYLSLGFALNLWVKGLLLLIVMVIYYWAVAFYKTNKKE